MSWPENALKSPRIGCERTDDLLDLRYFNGKNPDEGYLSDIRLAQRRKDVCLRNWIHGKRAIVK